MAPAGILMICKKVFPQGQADQISIQLKQYHSLFQFGNSGSDLLQAYFLISKVAHPLLERCAYSSFVTQQKDVPVQAFEPELSFGGTRPRIQDMQLPAVINHLQTWN